MFRKLHLEHSQLNLVNKFGNLNSINDYKL